MSAINPWVELSCSPIGTHRTEGGANRWRKLLAQLNAPLVEAVDLPDHALHEYFVFIQRKQHAQRVRIELLVQQGIAGAIAGKHLVRCQRLGGFAAHALGDQFGFGHRARLALEQRLGLRHAVGQQPFVLVGQRSVVDRRHQKIGGDQPGALVHQLEKCVLAIGAGRTPDDGAGVVVDHAVGAVDVLAVGFHVQLLQERYQQSQTLVVGKNAVGIRLPEIGVPDAQHAEDDRHVGFQWRFLEMHVHGMRTGQQCLEIAPADLQRDRQANRRPQRVAPADPVPENEHVFRIDAEGFDGFRVGRQGYKVAGNRCRRTQRCQQPGFGRIGVGQGLQCGECF